MTAVVVMIQGAAIPGVVTRAEEEVVANVAASTVTPILVVSDPMHVVIPIDMASGFVPYVGAADIRPQI